MNTTLTLTSTTRTAGIPARNRAAARLPRFLVCKWDMLAVLGLMASSAVYGVYALTQMTGF